MIQNEEWSFRAAREGEGRWRKSIVRKRDHEGKGESSLGVFKE